MSYIKIVVLFNNQVNQLEDHLMHHLLATLGKQTTTTKTKSQAKLFYLVVLILKLINYAKSVM